MTNTLEIFRNLSVALVPAEYCSVIRARCSVVPPEEYPRACPYISDGYRPNLSFSAASQAKARPAYCIGFIEIPEGRLYAGDSGDITVRAIVDEITAGQLAPGMKFELWEANHLIARCTVTEVQEIEAMT